MHFEKKKYLDVYSQGSIAKIKSFIQVMTWVPSDNTSLPEPMLVKVFSTIYGIHCHNMLMARQLAAGNPVRVSHSKFSYNETNISEI